MCEQRGKKSGDLFFVSESVKLFRGGECFKLKFWPSRTNSPL